MPSPEVPQPLDESEQEELRRLRAQAAAGAAGKKHGVRRTLRWVLSGVLILVVAVLALGSLVAGYARSEVLDTDRFVQTMGPLAANPAVQADLADQITTKVYDALDIDTLTQEALTALTEAAPRVPPQVVGLSPVLANQARDFIHQTALSVLGTEQFERAWVEANRIAHQTLVAVVTGDTKVVEIDQSGTVSLPLGPIVQNVTDALSQRGFAFADRVPPINAEFVLLQSPDLAKAQTLVRVLDRVATWLPWVAAAVAVAAVFAAPRGRRLRALSLVGLAVALMMALLAAAMSIARSVYMDDIPSDVLSADAASAIVDTVSAPLTSALRAIFVIGLVVALVGYLCGGSRSARAVRAGFSGGIGALRRPSRPARPFEVWAARLRVPLRIAIVVAAVALLLFWNYPTGLVVGLIALGAVVALVVLEVVARPGVVAVES